jgi:bifunctional DNase/RNase
VDSRPSDTIALAVRVSPIFVSESVVKSTESSECVTNLLEDEDELTDIMDKMKPEDFA